MQRFLLVDAIILRDNPASRSSMMSFTLIFLAIFLTSLRWFWSCAPLVILTKEQTKGRTFAAVLISGQHGLNCGLHQMG